MAEIKTDAVVEDLKALSQDAKKMVREAQDDAREKTAELSNKCLELLNTVVATAREVPSVAAAKTKEVAVTTDDYVHQNPWRAVTLSAGIGLVLGILLSKK